MPFDALGLAPALVRAVQEHGHTTPTPIQARSIPAALAGRDVLGAAQTGSGKTLAFALPLLQRQMHLRREWPRWPRALVLVPTRELALQVGEVVRALAQALPDPPRVTTVFGGVSINPQMMGLRGGTEVVVATPGRLLDLGFADELARVLAQLPAQRQHLFFSATFPPAVQALADTLLREPVRIEIDAGTGADGEPGGDHPDITQRAIEVDAGRRTGLLRHLVRTHDWERVLVFVATRHAADLIAHKLGREGLPAVALHGELSQGTRAEVLQAFRARRIRVLVVTDLAARGLDIPQLPAVVNYDLPRSAADHTHRIGRTGRAGASGVAVSFISAATEAHFRLIEKRQGRRVPREQVPGFEPVETATPDQAAGGIKGRRPSKKDKLRAAAAVRQGGDDRAD